MTFSQIKSIVWVQPHNLMSMTFKRNLFLNKVYASYFPKPGKIKFQHFGEKRRD